jgi:hypothetical protein
MSEHPIFAVQADVDATAVAKDTRLYNSRP